MTDTTISAVPAPAPTTAPTVTPQVEPHTKSGISDAEAATMAAWAREDLAKGKLTQPQADKIFNDLSTPLEQRAPDTRSDEVKQLDEQFPPGKPEDFLIRYGLPGQDVPMTPELKQFDANARAWLSGAEFPRDLGNSLVSTIEKVAQHTKAMTPAQLESYGMVEYEKLEKVYGEGLEEKLQAAGHVVEALEAKTPGLKHLLRSCGIGDSAQVVAQLIQASTVWHARRKGP